MANYNKVMLMGNLTRDPELRYTPTGTAVVNLRLAVNRKFRDRNGEQKDEVCFLTVVVWDKQAELCNQYLSKGRPIFVEGRLQSRNFEDKAGNKRNVLEVRAERVQFLGTRPASVESMKTTSTGTTSTGTTSTGTTSTGSDESEEISGVSSEEIWLQENEGDADASN